MSRIGNSPVAIPEGVTVTVQENTITVKGKLGELSQDFDTVGVKVEEGNVLVTRSAETKQHKAKHGLYRSLINNMVVGVSEGYQKKLELQGVGYRAKASGKSVNLTVGYSHPINYQLPEGVSAETPSQTEIVISGADKQLVGQVAARIREKIVSMMVTGSR